MKSFLKILCAAAVLVLGVIAINYLQFRFDRSDIEHAVQAVRLTRPDGPQGPTLEEKISTRYGVPPVQIRWYSEIESKTQGIIKVHAGVPGSPDSLSWQVDLVRFNIIPLTPPTEQIGKSVPK